MREIYAVIGANYGDEGKGRMTARLSRLHSLNVLYNGGMQRGHTASGHVYHCFGAGSARGADTYYARPFIIDVEGFYQEYAEIASFMRHRTIYCHKRCRIAIPYDGALNLAVEAKRGNARHGSCGMGILECRKRSEAGFSLPVHMLSDRNRTIDILVDAREHYLPGREAELGVTIGRRQDWAYYFECVDFFLSHVRLINSIDEISGRYERVLFEGGQGLALSETNIADWPHLTPSYTGSNDIAPWIDAQSDAEINLYYVTRPYLTRHGAGPLPGECTRETLNPSIIDATNLPNAYQGTLRFAYLSPEATLKRINADRALYRRAHPATLAVTQTRYSDGRLMTSGSRETWPLPEDVFPDFTIECIP